MVSLGNRTQVSRVAPDWDLSDALPTELPRRGQDIMGFETNPVLDIFISQFLLSINQAFQGGANLQAM